MNIAVDASAVRQPGRDEPTALADREALVIIRPYHGMVAWPTVWLALGIVAAFAAVTTLATLGVIPLWLGLILNTLVLYASQTPLHEACHGNIAGRDSRYMWLNHLVGYACGSILLHEYKAFRHMHLMHHRDTNDPELDPDHWVKAKNPLVVAFRCLTIVNFYNHFFFKHVCFKPGNAKLAVHIIGMYALYYGLAIGLSFMGYWREVLALWIVPHILASALIIYFFAYLTHQPHEAKERYRDTNVFWVRGSYEKLVDWLYLGQNFHLIHHLFPRIPFYKYREAFGDLKPVLDREGAHIFEIGDHRPATPQRR
jgi:beta-carotene hydroxylase